MVLKFVLGFFQKINQSEFINSFLILFSGTVISQIITFSLSPIISRLYSPEEMSYLTLLIRIISFLAVLATARYEIAFPLPKRNEHAFSLYRFSFSLTVLVASISFLIVLVIDINNLFGAILNPILYFIPFGVILVAFNSQGMNWSIRLNNFKLNSFSKILQSSINSILCIFFGFLSFGYLGLIYAFLISLLLSNIPFFNVFTATKIKMKSFKLNGRNFSMLKMYSDFPKINLPHVLMDLTKELFIAFYLIYVFDNAVLGLYDFSFRMLRLPISVIGVSISQVIFKKAADLINEKKSIYLLVKKTILMLFLISIIPFGTLFLFGEEIFCFVFGRNWKEAGVYSEIMAPWLMVNFIISPISQIPSVLRSQKFFFILSLISSIVLIFTLLLNQIFPNLNLVFRDLLKIVSLGQFICLSFILFWIMKLIQKKEEIINEII